MLSFIGGELGTVPVVQAALRAGAVVRLALTRNQGFLPAQTVARSLRRYDHGCLNVTGLSVDIYLTVNQVCVCACVHIRFRCTSIHWKCNVGGVGWKTVNSSVYTRLFFSSCSHCWFVFQEMEGVQIISWGSEFLTLPQASCVTLAKLLNTPYFDRGLENGACI